MIEVTGRSFHGRTTVWTGPGFILQTPSILFVKSQGYELPPYSEAWIEEQRNLEHTISIWQRSGKVADLPIRIFPPMSLKKDMDPVEIDSSLDISTVKLDDGEVAILPFSFELRRDARAFIESIKKARRQVGFARLIYAPGIMDLSNLALLIYMGVDLLDSSLLEYYSARMVLSRPEGTIMAQEAPWSELRKDAQRVREANLRAAWEELQLVRHMIRIGRLRELVEIRANATPWGVAALRLFDLEGYEHQEIQAQLTGPRFYANSKQSLQRPDIIRWRRRVMERWRPAPHKKVLLLLPCSAKKPYFTSKSHKAFREALLQVPNHEVVQELIVTSPLGIVPRELELFYPAAQYEIPVTGHWDLDEQNMVQEMVSAVISKGFEKVVCHLGHGYDFLRKKLDTIETCQGNPTSRASLEKLVNELSSICPHYVKPAKGEDRVSALTSAALFQFGEGGERLTAGCLITGNYPYSKIMHGGTQMGILTPERGMISLTLEGAERLSDLGVNWVEMEDFDLKGNLFAVGIKSAHEGLRIGDEAIVFRNGRLEGVGVAVMSGIEMVQMKKGEAVRIRHKRRTKD
ncbi:MAG: DUF5591 domain-containing protein [Methanomassiliicoccales archaeon]